MAKCALEAEHDQTLTVEQSIWYNRSQRDNLRRAIVLRCRALCGAETHTKHYISMPGRLFLSGVLHHANASVQQGANAPQVQTRGHKINKG